MSSWKTPKLLILHFVETSQNGFAWNMSWWTMVPTHVFICQATFIPAFGFGQMVDGSSFVPEVGEVTGNVKTNLTNNLLDISKWFEQNQFLVSSINLGVSSQ